MHVDCNSSSSRRRAPSGRDTDLVALYQMRSDRDGTAAPIRADQLLGVRQSSLF
jgi:hypothetical protein